MQFAWLLILTSLYTSVQSARTRRQGFIDLGSSRCNDPNGRPGICLSIRKCQPLVKLLETRSKQVEVVNFLRQSVCGYEGKDPKVCCLVETVTESSTPESPIIKSNTGEPESTTKSTPAQIFGGDKLPGAGECGKVKAQSSRVVGGVNSTLGAWPWMVALGYQSSNGGNEPLFLCGGSLINNRFVLTAAHCLTSKRKLMIARLGDLNLYESNDGASPIDVPVERTIIHENYNPSSFTNDIALIQLKDSVTYTDNIKPICLPLSREMRAKDFVRRQPFIAGWGSVSFAGPSSAVLLELQVPVVPEAECKRAFETFKTAIIDKRVICAGYLRGGKDACRGDSGGPLMDPNSKDKLIYQIGVVSYGYKCAEPGFPGIYTRVTSFADWIVNKVAFIKNYQGLVTHLNDAAIKYKIGVTKYENN